MKYPAVRKLAVFTLSFLFVLPTWLRETFAQSPQHIAPIAVAPPRVSSEAATREETFEIVWKTIRDQFYDPTFGGIDWEKVRARYAPRVAQATSNEELHSLLQVMLNELHQSHFLIIPPDAIPNFPSADGEEGDEAGPDEALIAKLKSGNTRLTEQLTNGIGIDLRILDGTAVVTRVEPGSSAARAGLRPGFVIKRADGISLDLVIEETLKHPMWQTIIRPEMHEVLLAGYINGEADSSVRLQYLDGKNRPRTVIVQREKLNGEMSPPIGNLPSMFTVFESKRLPRGVGYIRFNAFVPPAMEKLCGAIRSMRDAPGIVIDLRGNQGGLIGMIGGLAGLIDERQISLGKMQMRGSESDFYTFPQTAPYSGSVVVLIDGATQSAAEIFASGMQENHRAVVVGERSAGNTLPSVIKELPTGALFQYGFANYRSPRGTMLEGRGVTPDVSIKMDRRSLLSGRDPQLAVAVEQLKLEIARNATIVNVIDSVPPSPPPDSSESVLKTQRMGAAVARGAAGAKTSPSVAADAKAPEKTATTLPTIDEIFEKYVTARGGKAALEKVSSRVTRGKAEISSMNLTGTTELFEKAPNKAITNIHVPGLGLMQRGFDGTKGWWQDSMRGYIKFEGYGLNEIRRESNFYKELKLKELYNRLALVGKEKVGERETYVVQEMFGSLGAEKLYFDVESGLLLRRDNIYYEDYRVVDGIKLPFVIREETSSGFNFVFRVTEIKHNVVIDDATFVQTPSCFTDGAQATRLQ
jgi:carboxyl-terminal processing protease